MSLIVTNKYDGSLLGGFAGTGKKGGRGCPQAASTLGIFHDKRYGRSSVVPSFVPSLLEPGPEV